MEGLSTASVGGQTPNVNIPFFPPYMRQFLPTVKHPYVRFSFPFLPLSQGGGSRAPKRMALLSPFPQKERTREQAPLLDLPSLVQSGGITVRKYSSFFSKN